VAASLIDELRDRIGSEGPLTFAEFMRLALYHPTQGYYATRVPGHGTDYRTSPTVGPWFGRLVARELERMWEALDRPDPFWVIEVGAGQGDLAAGAMEAAGPLWDALRWRFVEQFERVQEWQRRRLGSAAEKAAWSSRLGEPPAVTGCVLGNEVLDNFPVHLLEVSAPGCTEEVYVDTSANGFVECLGPLSEPALKETADRAAATLAPGRRVEACPQLEDWCREAAGVVERGYLVLVDYGDVEPDLWDDHPAGTIECPRAEGLGPSPLEDPGSKDITAKVNFSALRRAAEAAGFEPEELDTQRDWLLSLGLAQLAEEIELAGFEAAMEGWVEQATVLQGQLGQLLELGAVGELGDLLVFRASKGVRRD